jgi:aminopeptidase N
MTPLLLPLLLAIAPTGIPRQLALDRARDVSNVSYKLAYTLQPHADSAAGHEELTFTLRQSGPLLLDFREGVISKMLVNGQPTQPVSENGHIVLPPLKAGANKIEMDFSAPVGPAGKAITRYEDKDDGSEYIYTLFVPMDASMAFPCFDQPDIKARFTLELNHPADWTVIANVPLGQQTEPISTYLFAFAAGPFQKIHSTPGLPDVYVRKSQVSRAQDEVPQIQRVTAQGMKFLAAYFAQPFPFPKYDMVLIPGFPYGGMEHAGATFLNEDSMLFRSAPTEADRFGRNITVLHELTHQWFGDFTTMRWFDDLWLKEGFAQYMAYRAMLEIAPQLDVWARFYQQIKPAAYGIDITPGTTPIYQNIPNLQDAKSAYGAIVYSKAPGLLRQLAFLLGEDHFRDGLRLYLSEHRYANAEWSDLVKAFERASGQSLSAWADAWIKRRGMPEVDVAFTCDTVTLSQKNILDEGGTWPIATQVLLGYRNAEPVRLRVQFDSASFAVNVPSGKACPDYVFANDEDHAYGLFLLDARSRAYIRENIGATTDLFRRTLMWGALFDAVHFAQMPPADYIETALRNLPSEQDETIVRSVSNRVVFALHEYISSPTLTRDMEKLASDRMHTAATEGLRILWFRAFVSVAQTPEALGEVKDILRGKASIPGVDLRPLDRWRMVTVLLAGNDPEAAALFEAETKRDASGIGQKYAYVAMAAKPDPANKRFYFDDYLQNKQRPEDWVQASLDAFNEWNQDRLTLPFLLPALKDLPQIKQQRKIFFVLAWLGAFIGGQHSAEASALVHHWLKETPLDPDLRLKVLQVLDELDRTAKIRATYAK